jgi:hypothetical protein
LWREVRKEGRLKCKLEACPQGKKKDKSQKGKKLAPRVRDEGGGKEGN